VRAIIGAAVLLAFVAQPVSARTTERVTRVCPFTGTEFTAEVEASGTRFCQRLDMKPVGAIGAPPLVPICPDDGFVVYKETFGAEEVSTLRGWVESDEFRRITTKESPYFRIAKTLERLSAPDDEVAWAYVQASWEIESDPETYSRYVEHALRKIDLHLEAIASDEPLPDGKWSTQVSVILSTELLRRLGRFGEARGRLRKLSGKTDTESHLKEIIHYEGSLIENSDSRRHYLPQEEEEKCSRSDRIGSHP
jgi:hypothetical protein